MIFATDRKWRERVATSLEVIADRLAGPDHALVARVAHLEELLKEFVSVMENTDSTDQEWAELLTDVKAALSEEVA